MGQIVCAIAGYGPQIFLSFILLAIYHGKWRGGTAVTVRYAQNKDRRLILSDPASLDAVSSLKDGADRLSPIA